MENRHFRKDELPRKWAGRGDRRERGGGNFETFENFENSKTLKTLKTSKTVRTRSEQGQRSKGHHAHIC
jgi:hypothetical protein